MNPVLTWTEFWGSAHIQDVIRDFEAELVGFGLKIPLVLISLFGGIQLARFLRRASYRLLTNAKFDGTVVSFITNSIYFLTLSFVGIILLEELGVKGTAIVAALTSSLLAVGLALQGSLAHFAAGVLIVLFRPFRVGDYIEGAEVEGFVQEIQLLSTKLLTLQNSIIIIPNSRLTDGNIINYSANPHRRIDMIFGVAYDDDIDQVKAVALSVLQQEPLILNQPTPLVAVDSLGDSCVNFAVRGYVKPNDYWPARFAVTEQIKKRFDAEGIHFPFPQRDVHLFNQN
ncbi:MAG: mechanosensitive ion channel [Spirulina sp. SIO3F2]|nr:mechanosensitive ion channel [Spirulina sp. SIO3F2]